MKCEPVSSRLFARQLRNKERFGVLGSVALKPLLATLELLLTRAECIAIYKEID